MSIIPTAFGPIMYRSEGAAIKWADSTSSRQRIRMDPHGPVANPPGGLFPQTQANPLWSPPESAADP